MYELPFHAINYCLQEANITLVDVDHIAYSYDPFLLLGRHRDDVMLELPLEPSAHPTAIEWESAWGLPPIIYRQRATIPGRRGISSFASTL